MADMSPDMSGQIDLFLDMMAAERDASAHTISAYRRDLVRLGNFLMSRGDNFLTVEPSGLSDFMAHYRLKKWPPQAPHGICRAYDISSNFF